MIKYSWVLFISLFFFFIFIFFIFHEVCLKLKFMFLPSLLVFHLINHLVIEPKKNEYFT